MAADRQFKTVKSPYLTAETVRTIATKLNFVTMTHAAHVKSSGVAIANFATLIRDFLVYLINSNTKN